jgi:hypothetical protein
MANKPGSMARVINVIGKAGINMRALSLSENSRRGILNLIVDNPSKAVCALQDAGEDASLTEVLAVEIGDTPGALSAVVSVIAEAGVNVTYMYAFTTSKENSACTIMHVDSTDKASEALTRAGVRLMAENEVYQL